MTYTSSAKRLYRILICLSMSLCVGCATVEVPNPDDPFESFNRSMYAFNDKLDTYETPYYRRDDLAAGLKFPGPAILLQQDSTTVVPPGWTFTADRFGNVLMENSEPSRHEANGDDRS